MPTDAAAPHRLAGLLQARSIAIIGASERNAYAISAVNNLRAIAFSGRLHLVNQRGGMVFGQEAHTGVAAIGEPVDLAYLCVPLSGVLDAMRECVAAGIRNYVVLTSGFAEVGGDGVALQRTLVDLCETQGLNVLGPNCLGFVNYADGVCVGSVPVVLPQPPASIAVISASGATAHQLTTYAQLHGIGLTHVIATGNEADITTADCIDYLIEHPAVKTIAIFLEAIRDREKFLPLAERALRERKPIVVLKVGRAPATAPVAAAHTAAEVGDDAEFDAICERYGIVRVDTFERLITTSAALTHIGVLEKRGVACISVSGGACEVMSDLAAAAGVPLPPFAPETRAELEKIVSTFGQLHNPLDLTGAAIKDPTLWEQMIRIIARDPQIGLVVCNYDPPQAAGERMQAAFDSILRGMGDAAGRTQMVTSYIRPLSEFSQHYLAQHRLPPPLAGMGDGMAALGRVLWWSERCRATRG